MLEQIVHGFEIAGKSVAGDDSNAGRRGDGHGPEGLAGVDIGNMHLHRRDGGAAQSIIDGVAVMRVGPRVDDDAAEAGPGGLDSVDKRALMVRLEQLHLAAHGGGVLVNQFT